MKARWQSEPARILCSWSGIGERTEYNPPWMQQPSNRSEGPVAVAVPDFTTHSPMGSGEWFVPWRLRWCVPGPGELPSNRKVQRS